MLELKTTPPALRPGLVTRKELLCRLESSSEPVIALVAPAGYGKTTLLSQFASRTDRPVAWLSLDSSDGDPTVLMSELTQTLYQSGLAPERSAPVESGSVLTRGVDQLLEGIEASDKGVLIIDHVDELPTQSSLDVLGAVMTKARDRLRVLVAARRHRGLPFGLLRAHGDLLELSGKDLALDSSEIEEIFAGAGISESVSLDAVMAATEGWPAAVYLTALAIEAGAPAPGPEGVRGNDLYLAEYFREELMKDVPREIESFLMRSSILPRMSGGLCDFVLETEHSAQTLEQLHMANLLVMPLDRTRTWFRYHSLLRDYLQADLHAQSPDDEAELNKRASVWFEDNGFKELAIDHARSAGDYDRVAALLTDSARTFYATGRNETLAGWLELLEESGVLGDHPELAAIGALARALGGDPGGAQRMALFAYDDATGTARDDSELGPLALMLRAYQAPTGVERAVRDATAAYEVLQHNADWAHASLGALALATYAAEGIDRAEPFWAGTLWRAESLGARPLVAVARGARTMAAVRRGEWDLAGQLMGGAIADIEESGLDTYITSALAYVQAARIAAHRGDLDKGRLYLGAAARIRPLLTVAVPVYSVLVLLEEAKAYIELADIAGARRLMRDASDILAMRPRLGTLGDEHEELKERLAGLPAGTVGPSSLTGAELRLLPLLVTHLTYPEIGDRLYISKHTVKTQAMSIFRKLGVSSRSDAVEKARAIGLISA
jgi:LuxR family maltose regulon positive regulatory protein